MKHRAQPRPGEDSARCVQPGPGSGQDLDRKADAGSGQGCPLTPPLSLWGQPRCTRLPDTPRLHWAEDTVQRPEVGLMHQHTLAVEALEVYTKQGGGLDMEAKVSPVTDLGGGRGESPPTHHPYKVTASLRNWRSLSVFWDLTERLRKVNGFTGS